jgi:ABC-2 type transport system permease protein
MKQNLKKRFRTGNLLSSFWILLIREFKRFFSDKELIVLSTVLPILLSVIFVWIYGTGMVRELPVAIFDEDRSELSRTMIEAIRSSSAMDIVKNVSSIEEIKQAFRSGTIQGAFYFPDDMERDLKRHKQVHPVVFKNSQNIISSGFLLKESLLIFKSFNGGILLKKLRNKGMTDNQAISIIKPVNIDGTTLYNSNFNYKNFLSPGIIFAQLQLLFMISGILLITREYDKKNLRAVYFFSAGRIYLVHLTKIITILLVSALAIMIIEGFIFKCVGIFILNVPVTFGMTMLYVAVSVVYGMGIGALLRNTLVSTEVAVFLGIPAFIMSGYTFPLWAVPHLLAVCAQILPFTHFFTLYYKVAQMNLQVKFFFPEIHRLLIMTIIPLVILSVRSKVDYYKFSSSQKQV